MEFEDNDHSSTTQSILINLGLKPTNKVHWVKSNVTFVKDVIC